MMDECCAPQWTDLTSSPQVPSDDYFDKIHEVHEPLYFKQLQSQANSTTIANANETLKPEEEFETNLSIIKSTPIKVISPNSKNQNVIVIKETTYDDVLCEAMKNLELSVKKKKSRKSVMNQSSSNTLKTPTTRVLRSATRNSVKKVLDESDVYKTPKAEDGRSVPQKTVRHESSIYKTPKGQEVQGATSQDHTNNEPGICKALHLDEPEEVPQKMVPEESAVCMAPNAQPLKDSAQEIIDNEPESCEEPDAHGDENISQESHNKSDMHKDIVKSPMTHETQDGAEEDQDNENSEIAQDLQQNVEKKSDIPEDGKHEIPSNLVTSFKPRQNSNSQKERKSLSGNQNKVLAGQYCQYRRRSIMKIQRRSGKYVSLAEAVTKYQNGTPKRFRSISSKESKLCTAAKLRRASLKLTVPISPALTSKTRTRPVTVLSHEQREELEIEEIKKHPIKAHPLNLNALKGPQHLKKPEKKPITIPEPFHLTESYKTRANSTTNLQDSVRIHDSTTKSLHHADSGKTVKQDTATFKAPQIIKKLNKTSELFNTSTFSRSRMTSTSSQDSIRCHDLPVKKLVPSVVSSDDKGIVVKNEEVLYFGIPNVQHSQKKSTHAVPFSFELRNKEFQKKKEEKLKQLHDQESHKVKPEFRAKPAPNFCKSQIPQSKETVAKKSTASSCPFSFEARNNQLLKKKEELVKQVVMEEKKARVFHAKPAPEFKPVVVHGVSRDNKPKEKPADVPRKGGTTEAQLNKDQKNKNLTKTNRRTVGHVLHQEGRSDITDGQNNHKEITANVEKNSIASENKQVIDQENRQPNIMSRRTFGGNLKTEKSLNKNQPKKFSVPTLNTDKRMKQRQQFDEKVRQKEMEEEFKRQKAEEERLAKEKLEKALLRKQAESKARPMPVYKPMVLVKSTKPLTNPQSPAFTFKMKQRVLAARVENEA